MLARLLAEEGAIPIELPAIEIEPSADPAAVGAAIDSLTAGRYGWAVFTSANAVELWFEHLRERGLDARAFAATKVAAIGPATAEALAERGIVADLVPEEYVAEAVVEALRARLRCWGPEPAEQYLDSAAREGARPSLSKDFVRPVPRWTRSRCIAPPCRSGRPRRRSRCCATARSIS